MAIKVACPECAQSYNIKPKLLGKNVTCKTCGKRFRLQTAASMQNAPPPLPRSRPKTEPAPEKPKGFFGKMKESINQSVEPNVIRKGRVLCRDAERLLAAAHHAHENIAHSPP